MDCICNREPERIVCSVGSIRSALKARLVAPNSVASLVLYYPARPGGIGDNVDPGVLVPVHAEASGDVHDDEEANAPDAHRLTLIQRWHGVSFRQHQFFAS